jgi:transcriptional regulatory protein LEU3
VTNQLINPCRSCTGSGQPALALLEVFNEQAHFRTLLEELPPTFQLQIRISSIISSSQKAFLELGLFTMTLQQERTMDSLIKVFDTELSKLELKVSSPWDRLYLAAARQEVAAMHFYKSMQTLDIQSSMGIFDSTARVFELLQDLERDHKLSDICTRYIFMSALLAISTMVRLLKGPFAANLDQARGSTLYQMGLNFLQSCSIEKTDLPERAAVVAEQIWKSEKIFKDASGSVNMTLRIRDRLSASPFYDALAWWREEFVENQVPGVSGPPTGNLRFHHTCLENSTYAKQKCKSCRVELVIKRFRLHRNCSPTAPRLVYPWHLISCSTDCGKILI